MLLARNAVILARAATRPLFASSSRVFLASKARGAEQQWGGALCTHRAARWMSGNHFAMDADDMAAVSRTWKMVSHDLDTHGERFFQNLFKIDPSLRSLFTFKDENAPHGTHGVSMMQHGKNVLKIIGDAASNTTDVTKMKASIKDLGGRHSNYGVKPEYFPIMGQALIMTLEEELGGAFTPKVKAAWEQAYLQVCSVLLPGLEEKM